jgi:hypothetical protein
MIPLVQFVGVTILAILTAATIRVLCDLIVNGEQMVREKREAGEEEVYVGMYVDDDGKVVVKTRKRKHLWRP